MAGMIVRFPQPEEEHAVTLEPPSYADDERKYSRLGWRLLLVGFGGFVLWASLAPLDKGVTVSGQVVVAGNRQAVQHPSGGIVQRLNVKDGDQVVAGQVLATLDTTRAAAEQQALRGQYLTAQATLARLNAERDDAPQIDFPQALRTSTDPLADAAMELQRQLMASRRAGLRLALEASRQTEAGYQASLDAALQAQRHHQLQAASLTEQLDSLRGLARDGFVARNRVLELERQFDQLNGDLANDGGNIGRTRRQILQTRAQASGQEAQYREEVRQQLADTRSKAEDLGSRLATAQFELDYGQIRAPAAGTVMSLSVFTAGGVVAPGQTLMEIVPADAPLLVDARAPVESVDRIKVGQSVELLFTAFNQTRTPRVPGEVQLVSADRLIDDATGQPYYLMRVQVSEDGLQQLHGEHIRPGMPVEAFVRTGERSMLSYLFKPLLDRSHLAMSEE